jgi:four helix bundle protein
MPNRKATRFEELIAWQKARELTSRVYRLTLAGKFARDFVLCDQIRRSAISVPSNIAEGFERGGRREFAQFLSIAKSSCAELRTQLCIAKDVGYVDEETVALLLRDAEEVARIIGGLRSAVARQRTQSSVLSPQS